MTVDTFNPDIYIPQIYEAFGLNKSFALTPTMKILDLFAPRIDTKACQPALCPPRLLLR
jgi:hypothetical protein